MDRTGILHAPFLSATGRLTHKTNRGFLPRAYLQALPLATSRAEFLVPQGEQAYQDSRPT